MCVGGSGESGEGGRRKDEVGVGEEGGEKKGMEGERGEVDVTDGDDADERERVGEEEQKDCSRGPSASRVREARAVLRCIPHSGRMYAAAAGEGLCPKRMLHGSISCDAR